MKNSICAIIVTYRIGRKVMKCFDAIVNQVDEIVIVDNGSDEETISVLTEIKKENHGVKIFYNQTNLGIAAALNIGVDYAIKNGYDWILTLDHDSEAEQDMVEKLLNAGLVLSERADNDLAIIAANPIDTSVHEYLYEQKIFDNNCDIAAACRVISSGSLIKSSVFGKTGFFNESLFMYFVDDEFCLRCRNNNLGIYVCRSAILHHKEGDKKKKKFLWKIPSYNNYDSQARYYISRNAVYMVASYLKSKKYRAGFGLIRIMLRDTAKILFFENNKAVLIHAALKGFFDGVTGKYGRIDQANHRKAQ